MRLELLLTLIGRIGSTICERLSLPRSISRLLHLHLIFTINRLVESYESYSYASFYSQACEAEEACPLLVRALVKRLRFTVTSIFSVLKTSIAWKPKQG